MTTTATPLDKVTKSSATSRDRDLRAGIDAEFKELRAQVTHLTKELGFQKAMNKKLWQGETAEDIERADKNMEAIRSMGYKPGKNHRYTYYDRRLEKKDRKAPRHKAVLETPPDDLTLVQEEWAKNAKIKWGGDGPFPYVFEPVEEAEAA